MRGAERGEHVDGGIFQLHRPSQTDLVDPVSVHEVQLDRHCERSADEGRIAELLGVCHRLARTDQRLIELRDHSLAECQHDQGLHKQGRAVLGVVERAFENSDGFRPVVVVEVYSGQQVERGSSQRPRRQLVQGLFEQRAGSFGVAGVEMVFGRMDSAFGLVAAEADCEFHQLGRSGRRAPGRRFIGRGVQSVQCFRVRAGGRQRHMPGPQLGHRDGLRQRPVHGAALSRTRVGIDAVGQQRVGESHQIAVNPDDALGFCVTKRLDGGAGDLSE